MTPPPAGTKTVKVSMFGQVAIADGAIILMDGGIHGIQGHTLSVPSAGATTWERRLDGMYPNGKAGSGSVELDAAELTDLRTWADGMWKLAAKGSVSFDPPREHGVPHWVWAIVLRRGDEVRVLDGGGMSPPDNAPDPVKQALEWLVKRVNALSGT